MNTEAAVVALRSDFKSGIAENSRSLALPGLDVTSEGRAATEKQLELQRSSGFGGGIGGGGGGFGGNIPNVDVTTGRRSIPKREEILAKNFGVEVDKPVLADAEPAQGGGATVLDARNQRERMAKLPSKDLSTAWAFSPDGRQLAGAAPAAPAQTSADTLGKRETTVEEEKRGGIATESSPVMSIGDTPMLGQLFRREANSETQSGDAKKDAVQNGLILSDTAALGFGDSTRVPSDRSAAALPETSIQKGVKDVELAMEPTAQSVAGVTLGSTLAPASSGLALKSPEPLNEGREKQSVQRGSEIAVENKPSNNDNLPFFGVLEMTAPSVEAERKVDYYRMDPALMSRYGLRPKSDFKEKEKAVSQLAPAKVPEPTKVEKRLGEVAWADYDGDGRLDFMKSHSGAVQSTRTQGGIDPVTSQPLPPAQAPVVPAIPPASSIQKEGFVQTLAPETAEGLLREKQVAQDQAAKYDDLYRNLSQEQAKGPEAFGRAVAQAVPDQALSRSLSELKQIEDQAAQVDAGAVRAPLNDVNERLTTLRREVADRSSAILRGIETQVNAQTATANNLSDAMALLTKGEADQSRLTGAEAKQRTLAGVAAKPEAGQTYTIAPPANLDANVAAQNSASLVSTNQLAAFDHALPKTSPVRIIERAEAEPWGAPTFWERAKRAVTGTTARTVRVEVGKDNPDIAPLLYGAQTQVLFDPYFIQTEFEKIKSKTVLYKVIEKLALNDAWARKYGTGEKLSVEKTYQRLVSNVDVKQSRNTSLMEIRVSDEDPEVAARIANTIAEVYGDVMRDEKKRAEAIEDERRQKLLASLPTERQQKVLASLPAGMRARLEANQPKQEVRPDSSQPKADAPPPKLAPTAPIPQPEVETSSNAFSTFSLNVADVSFKLAAANLDKGLMPDPATVRTEEFINAFDYHDPAPAPGVPVAFTWEQARYPFSHDRDVLRFSIKTAAQGRQAGYPLNLVVLLDKSGSMERADRVQTVREALRVLAGQLQPQDKLSVITFARTARLWADAVPGNQASQVIDQVSGQTPEGGTNLEDALGLAYQTALKNYVQGGGNRVVLLTDGAANLGNIDPEALQQKVEANRKQGVALDCFGIGWEGFNDEILETLSSHGDGRYGFLNSPEEAEAGFAGQLAGALRVAAADVKVQVEFNPKRITAYRQLGYAKHQLTKEQFRDNTVDAAELGAAESGNALYVVQVNSQGEGDLAWVRVRYKVPSTGEYREHEWPVPFSGASISLEQAAPALRLATAASAFSEWLVSSPYAADAAPDRLLGFLRGVPEAFGADPRPRQLETMIRQAKSLAGK